MPSACVVETSSKDTGWASSRASAASAWAGTPNSDSESSGRPSRTASPGGSPVRWAWRSLTDQLAGARQHRCESDPEEVEGRRERQHVEVGDRDETALRLDGQRVVLRGVELDRNLAQRELEHVAQGAVQLDDVAECERVLQVSRRPRLPEVATGEQGAEAGQQRHEAGVRACLADRGVENRQIGREGLEVERRADVQGVGEPDGIRDGERRERRRVRAAVEQPDPVLRFQRQLSEQRVGEIGGLRQVGLPDRAERSNLQPALRR